MQEWVAPPCTSDIFAECSHYLLVFRFRKCISYASPCFCCHSSEHELAQTVNVWSHLFGFLLFISLAVYVYSSPALHLIGPKSVAARQPVPMCLPVPAEADLNMTENETKKGEHEPVGLEAGAHAYYILT
jgi:hypothetical protein